MKGRQHTGHSLLKSFSIRKHSNALALLSYAALFGFFFIAIRNGNGQYWDWTFPYFIDQISNLYTYKSLSWTEQDMGAPLLYSSDYFLRLFMSLFGFMNPETLRYVLMVGTFAFGAFGVFLIARQNTRAAWAFLLGMGAFINPAILYKLTAGHFNYLVAYVLFIYLVYFLFYKYDKSIKSAVITGLLLAFMGVQIQFLIIGAGFIALYLLFNRSKLELKQIAVIVAITLLIHAVWLSNFLSGAASVAGTSSAAAAVSVEGSMTSAYSKIFTFHFSKATLLDKFYSPYSLLWHSLFFVFLPAFLLTKMKDPRKDTKSISLLLFLLLLILLSTGILQMITIHPLSVFVPLFREVGHFAPLIVLTLLLLAAFRVKDNMLSYGFFSTLAVAMLIGINVYYDHPQDVDYATARQKFQSVKTFLDANDSTARTLYYPFFNQYSFTDTPNKTVGSFPLGNSGHDSFFTFSGKEFVNNAVPPHQFKESLQYRLLNSYDVDILEPYNIRYIVNLSDIYESNFEQYAPKTTYDNNLSLIKNDPAFFDKLLEKNPGKIRRINDKVLELTDYHPRVAAISTLFTVGSSTNIDAARQLVDQELKKDFNYLEDDELVSPSNTHKLESLFGEIGDKSYDRSSGTLHKNVTSSKQKKAKLYADSSVADAYYTNKNGKLKIYTLPMGTISFNGTPLEFDGIKGARDIFQSTLDNDKKYYLELEGRIIPINESSTSLIGMINTDSKIRLLIEGNQENAINNASFEDGLWREEVQDCNNYDSRPDIGMSLDKTSKTDGLHSLSLTAKRHSACTSTYASVNADTDYLLAFDYQSPNANQAHFYISFDNSYSKSIEGTAEIKDLNWQRHYTLVRTPDDAAKARLYVYAHEGNEDTRVVNRYDNFTFKKVRTLNSIVIPDNEKRYVSKDIILDSVENEFIYTVKNPITTNLMKNASFEEGPWQNEIQDCNNYDGNADIGMKIINGTATDGNSSLRLSAKRHIACTLTEVSLVRPGNYMFGFDVRGKETTPAGYYIAFNDPNKTVFSEKITLSQDNTWQKFTKKVVVPPGATSATLYIYSYETDGKTDNAVYYDNFQLTKTPDIENVYYLFTESQELLTQPEQVQFANVNPTKKKVSIKSAGGSFLLNFSESFHPGWKLYLRPTTDQTDCQSLDYTTSTGTAAATTECKETKRVFEGEEFSYLYEQHSIFDSEHKKTNGYANGWIIDPEYIKQNFDKQYYTEHADGTIDIDMVIYFKPQSYFYIGLILSGATILGAFTYLLLSSRWRKRTYYAARSEKT